MFSILLLPLLTILMSGVIASIVTFKLNARLQRRDFMRGKIEELYTHLHLYCNLLRRLLSLHLGLS
jgi:hypothetical protein